MGMTMRLIDVDKLNIYDVSPAYGTCVMGVTEEDIELAPTVDAEPVRHGYITLKTIYGRDRVNCSVCGYEYARMDGDIHNYCPNCGAKMDGDKKKSYFPKGFFSKERPLAKGEEE